MRVSRRVRVLVQSALLVSATGCGDNLQPPYEPWLLEQLEPSEGFGVRTPEFTVGFGEEIQDCYFFEVPDLASGQDLLIDRTVLALNPGSHHMNVFRVQTVFDLDPNAGEPVDLGGIPGRVVRGGECWNSPNWSDWPLVANSQESSIENPILDWPLPAGVASRFSPGETLMLQVHYVNANTQETPYVGRAGINLYRSTDGDAMELGTLFATQQSIRVCRSNPQPRYSGTCAMPTGTHTVAAANGHFHSRGRRFQIFSWDGVSTTQPSDTELFYDSRDWAEPEMAIDVNRVLPEDGGIWWSCQYQWIEPSVGCAAVDAADPQQAGDCCYTFGPKVETSEHCNVFMYYYPKTTEDITCF